MNKNTLIGFVLMALVMFGFMAYENHNRAEQAEQAEVEAKVNDSIAKIEKSKEKAKEDAKAKRIAEEKTDSTNAFFQARQGKESTVVLENENLIVTLSTKGAKLQRVELKSDAYKNNDALTQKNPDTNNSHVVLFDKGDQQISFKIDGKNDDIVTDEFCFVPEGATKNSVTLRLPVAEGSIAVVYTLKPNSYVLDMDVKADGLKDFISTKAKTMTMVWQEKMKQQEKGYDFETRYSTITYRDTEGDTDELSSVGADDDVDASEFENKIQWIAYKTQFFSQVLVADTPVKIQRMYSVREEKGSGYLKEFYTEFASDIDPSGVKASSFHLYLGPNDFSILDDNEEIIGQDIDLRSLVYMGWPIVRWINRFFFLYLFDFLTGMGLGMGLVLILLTLLVKFIVYPLMKKSYMASANMRVLKPKIAEINAKYPNKEDAMLKQQETMRLYSEYGVSPMGGCLPMLIQMPIWIALFNFIPNYIKLRGESFLWADDLSTYDDVISFGGNVPGIGDHLSIFCLLWCLSTIANSYFSSRQQKDMMSPEQQQQMGCMKWMMYLMPIFFFFTFNSYSAGLNLYYFLSTLISVAMMWYMRKSTNDADLLAKLEARHKERKSNNSSKKGSSMMQRLQAMQEKQMEILKKQQEERARKEAERKNK